MHHKLLTQRALFCIGVNAKKGTLNQHFVTHVRVILMLKGRESPMVAIQRAKY